MPKLKGYPWDEGRKLFDKTEKKGNIRCQAYAHRKVAALREKYGGDENITPEIAATAQCAAPSRIGKNVCRCHGGGNKGSVMGRPVETGRYSKFLPKELSTRFDRAMEDPTLIELRAEMALIVARIEQLLREWGTKPPSPDEILDGLQSLGEALKAEDIETAQDEYLRLIEIVNSGRGEWAAWKEITKLIEQRRRLATSEVRRLEALNQMLTVQQALAFLAVVTDIIIKAEIPEESKKKIANELRKLSNLRSNKILLSDSNVTT